MNIALFGGSFDPPHLGHEYIVYEVVQYMNIHKVYIIPAYISPFKTEYFASPEDRLNMVEYMTMSLNNMPSSCEFTVLRSEILRRKKSFTWKTLKEIEKMHSQDSLYVILGDDQSEKFEKWKKWKYIIEKAELIVFPRLARNTEGTLHIQNRIHRIPLPRMHISSQEIRRFIAEGSSVRAMLNKEVYSYIREHSLYEL